MVFKNEMVEKEVINTGEEQIITPANERLQEIKTEIGVMKILRNGGLFSMGSCLAAGIVFLHSMPGNEGKIVATAIGLGVASYWTYSINSEVEYLEDCKDEALVDIAVEKTMQLINEQ